MKELSHLLGNYSLFITFTLLLSTLQCTLWFQIFGSFPPPHMWIINLCYWALYRSPKEGFIMAYIVSLLIAPLTAMPLSILFTDSIVMLFLICILKNRIYWPGPTYFMMISGLMVGLFPLIHFFMSVSFEKNAVSSFDVFDWLIRTLLSTLVAWPIFSLFHWFDRITKKELPAEMGAI